MSTPQKPWEGNGAILNYQDENMSNSTSRPLMSVGRNVLNSNAPHLSSQPMGSARSVFLPPLPPRPPQISIAVPNRPTFGMAPSICGGYSGYSGYGGYSSYGNYQGSMYLPGAYGYGSYGQPGNAFENRFSQAAEESSRSAFQSVESLVRAFTSVSMMLESTYHAMYSSFRAILGVVDNFSRLRQMFAQFFSAITILRIMKNFYHRLLHWLGVIDHDPQSEGLWEAAAAGSSYTQTTNYSSWPLFIFIGLLFGGPYLISKFFSPNVSEPKKWNPKQGTFYRASYPHEAASDAELSFAENELVNVAPQEFQLPEGNGWLLACNCYGKVGYVPITRLNTNSKQDVRLNPSNVPTKSTNDSSSVQLKH